MPQAPVHQMAKFQMVITLILFFHEFYSTEFCYHFTLYEVSQWLLLNGKSGIFGEAANTLWLNLTYSGIEHTIYYTQS